MPYISKIASSPLTTHQRILPPQHIVVNPFTAYPVSEKGFVHQS